MAKIIRCPNCGENVEIPPNPTGQIVTCVACGTAAVHDGTPRFLRLPHRRGTAPYWERGDVWARTGFGAITDDLARDVLAERAEER